jgi:drug/metabolite transporter (DMT)-like permease
LSPMLSIGIIAALASMLLWSVSVLLSKIVAPRLGTFRTAALVVSTGVIPMLLLFLLSPTSLYWGYALASVAAGIALAAGYFLFYKSVESANISNVGGIDLLQPVVLALFGVFILMEPINAVQALGAVMVFAGVGLLSTKKTGGFNRKLLPAALGNISWAFYWIILSTVINSTGQYVLPLLIARVTGAALTILALAVVARRRDTASHHASTPFAKLSILAIVLIGIMEGFFDSGGNIAFGLVIKSSFIGIGAVITALEPAIIALCAHYMFRDRLNRVQAAGLAAAILGAALIALF